MTALPTPTPEVLNEAHQAALQADDEKDALTRQLHAARAKSKALWKRYDDLVLIALGQQTLDYDNNDSPGGDQ